MASKALAWIARTGESRHVHRGMLPNLIKGVHSPREFRKISSPKIVPSETFQLLRHFPLAYNTLQRFQFSSSASPQSADKETEPFVENDNASETTSKDETHRESTMADGDSSATEQIGDAEMEDELSRDDLIKLVAEKDELLKLKDEKMETMHDRNLRICAEMQNVVERTKREAENSKKFANQTFVKGLLDVADNLGRASSVVKESFSKIDSSKDSVGAVPLLKTLLEGVEMTNKQLVEVFRKFGVEKFDPTNEQFDPHRHHAVFQMPDASKPPGTVTVVVKSGYMLHERVIRPAEVGVTQAPNNETE